MKLLLDENIPIEAEAVLQQCGCDALHVCSVKMSGKDDSQIMAFAQKEKRILVTLDLDFSNILTYPPKTHFGIIAIRLLYPKRKKIIDLLVNFVQKIDEVDISKSLIILEENGYRVRK
ncbi:MAG: DUF5615 family PIN-like protein [Candidatus Margulisbacteria bacterium]|nr:DUF5615 family PIN-like protein [Candidatus Margulisiibacteriota bacterium]